MRSSPSGICKKTDMKQTEKRKWNLQKGNGTKYLMEIIKETSLS